MRKTYLLTGALLLSSCAMRHQPDPWMHKQGHAICDIGMGRQQHGNQLYIQGSDIPRHDVKGDGRVYQERAYAVKEGDKLIGAVLTKYHCGSSKLDRSCGYLDANAVRKYNKALPELPTACSQAEAAKILRYLNSEDVQHRTTKNFLGELEEMLKNEKKKK